MNVSGVLELKTFVPAKDYDTSTRFYQDRGFEVAWESAEIKEMRIDPFSFLLQNYYQKDWAGNFMLHLKVDDLDAWCHCSRTKRRR